MKNDNQDKEKDRKHHGWRHDPRHLSEKIDQLRRVQFGQRGFLRPQIMELFEQGPMNGVDIMNKLQEQSRGWYRPSPGSIYPLLEQLEREALIVKNAEGKYQELTAAYAEQSGVGDDIASALSAMESNASYLEDLQRSDAARLAKCKDRLEKLAKRMAEMNDGLQQGRGTS